MKVLGVRYGHDAGAALVVDGKVVANVSEERFSRIKNDGSFPLKSIDYCLKYAGIKSEDLDVLCLPTVVFQEAFWKFFDIPENIEVLKADIVTEKKMLKKVESIKITASRQKVPDIRESVVFPTLPIYRSRYVLNKKCKVFLVHHHLSHAASACYTSGFNNESSLCVTMDGVGDGVSVGIFNFDSRKLECIKTFSQKASLAWFYALATESVGWRQSRDEWKLMGLAAFGEPSKVNLDKFHPHFDEGKLIKEHDFGFIGRWLDHGANHYHSPEALELSKIANEVGHKDFSAEVQRVVCEQAMKIIMPWMKKTQKSNLCCAGGFFLNVKFNQRIWETGKVKKHWVYPDSGDSGLPLGSALFAFHYLQEDAEMKMLDNMYKGPGFTNEEIEKTLNERGIKHQFYNNIAEKTANLLLENKVVGWFQGRMEAGPRALGNRSIIMSPLREENRDIINKKIKYRETFRPFCPSILYEKKDEYLKKTRDAYYMVISFETKENAKERIPAVVHVDNTARPQFVKRDVNAKYYDLINNFGKLTGEYAILNTSMNIKGEPIVCTPREALKCFYDTGMDALVLGDFLIVKNN